MKAISSYHEQYVVNFQHARVCLKCLAFRFGKLFTRHTMVMQSAMHRMRMTQFDT